MAAPMFLTVMPIAAMTSPSTKSLMPMMTPMAQSDDDGHWRQMRKATRMLVAPPKIIHPEPLNGGRRSAKMMALAPSAAKKIARAMVSACNPVAGFANM